LNTVERDEAVDGRLFLLPALRLITHVPARYATARRLLTSTVVGLTETRLRYLDAAHVETPMGRLSDMAILSPTAGKVGKLDGIVFDPFGRHVCYFVVKSRRGLKSRQYLLPVTTARIDSKHRTLEVDLEPDDLHQLSELRSDSFPRFSDDDLISALFCSPAA
jgi:PRC-barrel domain protein